MVHGWNVLISELRPRNPKKYNNFGLRLEVRKLIRKRECKMSKISIWQSNRTDDQGNIISGYQDISKNVTREQAITDYLYYLQTSEGIENPKCECIEIDWE